MISKRVKTMLLLVLALVAIFTLAIWFAHRLDRPQSDIPAPEAKAQVQTETIQSGYGDRTVASGDFITVKYVGSLSDGTMFDANLSASDPYRVYIGTGTAFPGWDQGLLGMKIGESRKLTVPAGFVSDSPTAASKAPADITVFYNVELLEIK